MKKSKEINTRFVSLVASLAAVLYSSWIVGYLLDFKVAAYGTASELAALGQPHRTVFIITDILMLTAVTAVTVYLLPYAVKKSWSTVTLVLYWLFGLLTVISTFMPLKCAPSVVACSGDASYSLNHLLAGAFAFLSLFMAMLIIAFYAGPRSTPLILATIFIWIAVALINTSLNMAGLEGIMIALSQRLFLLVNAIFLVVVPVFMVSRLKNT